MAERDTRWESVRGSSSIDTITVGEQEIPVRRISLTVYSDRFGEWRTTTTTVPVERLERHDWLEAKSLEFLVRDVATLEPR